jgi:prepilin-type N-terminal cleavage/methylation domain-containing protein
MKRGFTLIELVFVIVIIGILSAILAPRFDRPSIAEATNKLVSHIRYTQHLAMMDNKFDPTQQFWYRERWHILFDNTAPTITYTIASNRDGVRDGVNDLNVTDIAVNPSNQNLVLTGDINITGVDILNVTPDLNLRDEYGIESLGLTGSCVGRNAISFDYLGRPIAGNSLSDLSSYGATTNLLQARCVIILRTTTDPDTDNNTRRIAIEPETGYVHII